MADNINCEVIYLTAIHFYKNSAGTDVALWPGKCKNTSEGPRKEGQFYLGTVIDREKLIFYKRSEGFYQFDPYTVQIKALDPKDIPVYTGPQDHRIHPQNTICVFGGNYFLHRLISGISYDKVIDVIPFKNKDTLYTMLHYYLLSNASDLHAEFWYQNSYAHFIYPKANIASQRLSDFYASIGKPDVRAVFLTAHIEYIRHLSMDDIYVMIDSTGCPNAIGIPITAVSKHENEVNIEFRVIAVIQKSTGLPLYYEIIPGNVVDISTIHNVLRKLGLMGCKVHYVIGDAGYNCPAVMERLVFEGIDFMTRMNPTYDLYREILKKHYDELVGSSAEHITKYNGRLVKVLKIPSVIGKDKETGEEKIGYIYLCKDLQAHHSKANHMFKSDGFTNKTIEEQVKLIEKLGIFAIVTTLDVSEDEILAMYYTRQMIEQFFDYIKSYGKLTPVRKHTMSTVHGHVLMSFIAAFLAVLIKNRLNIVDLPYVSISSSLADSEDKQSGIVITCEPDDNDKDDDKGKETVKELILSQDTLVLGFKPTPEALFQSLQLYSADVWDDEIVPAVATKAVKDFYEAFGINIPETILRKNEGILPVLRKGVKDTCTKKKVFSRKPVLTNEQIKSKRAKADEERLKKMAEAQGMTVVSKEEQDKSTTQENSNEGTQESKPEKRKAGRPAGSKNKKTLEREKEAQKQAEQGIEPPPKRPRGRPVGSKTKNRDTSKKLGRPVGSKDKVTRKRRTNAKTTEKAEA